MTRMSNNAINELSFFGLFHKFNKKYLVTKMPLWIALLSMLIVRRMIFGYSRDTLIDIVKYLSNTGSQICSTLLGILIAGLAIIIAVVNGKLANLLLKGNILQRLLFPFWLVAACWGVSLGCLMISYPLYPLLNENGLRFIILAESFLISFSLSATVGLIGNTIQIGLIIAHWNPDGARSEKE